MKFKFTQYSFINALWSLIPIFPVWSVYPVVLTAMGIEKLGSSCEQSYTISLWLCISLTLFFLLGYLVRLPKMMPKKTEKDIKTNFRIFNLIMYVLINSAFMINILGIYYCCKGDGQSILVVIYSGPIASVSLIVIGLITDLKNFWQTRRLTTSP